MTGSSRPLAVIIFVDIEPDAFVARQVRIALRGTAFDVESRGCGSNDASHGRKDERALFEAHVIVPIVSRSLLRNLSARDQLSVGTARVIKENVLLAPVVIESLEGSLGDGHADYAARSLRRAQTGLDLGRPPTEDEIDQLAGELAREVVARDIWHSPYHPDTAIPVPAGAPPSADKDVFISHADEDKGVAEAVLSGLEQAGVGCWIAPRDILPGTDYTEALVEGIKSCRILVLVYSAASNASPNVRKEVDRAANYEKLIIPWRIEDVPLSSSLEYHLSSAQWLDAMTPPLDKRVRELVAVVGRQIDRIGPVLSTAVPAGAPEAIPQGSPKVSESPPWVNAGATSPPADRAVSRATTTFEDDRPMLRNRLLAQASEVESALSAARSRSAGAYPSFSPLRLRHVEIVLGESRQLATSDEASVAELGRALKWLETTQAELALMSQSVTAQARFWTDQEIVDVVMAGSDDVAKDLLKFTLAESHQGRIQSGGRKVSAAFGFYVHVRKPDGSDGAGMCFNYVDGARKLVVYQNWKPESVPAGVLARYRDDLRRVLGPAFDVNAREPNVLLSAVGANLEAFKDAIRDFQRQVDPDRS